MHGAIVRATKPIQLTVLGRNEIRGQNGLCAPRRRPMLAGRGVDP
jgi:hypothetical protein